MVTQTTMSNQQNDSSKDSGASSSREKKKRGLSLDINSVMIGVKERKLENRPSALGPIM